MSEDYCCFLPYWQPPRVNDGIGHRGWISRGSCGQQPGRGGLAGAGLGHPRPAEHIKTLRLHERAAGPDRGLRANALFAKLPAYVQKFHWDIGDRVEQDKPLADLWIPELQDEVRQKEAMVVHAKAGVQQATDRGTRRREGGRHRGAGLREARAGTIRAWASTSDGSRSTRGSRSWRPAGASTAGWSTKRRMNCSAAEAARGEAEAKVASAEAALVERTVGVEKPRPIWPWPRPASEMPKPTWPAAIHCSNYTQIRMPYTGIVIQRNVDRGDFVQPANIATAKPLFVVARNDMVRIFVDVPEMEAAQIEVGAKGVVHVQALPNRTIEGTVTRTSWALGANRTLRTELDVPNPQGCAPPGMYATAEIVLQEHAGVLTLPLSAVITVDKQAFCCCVENGAIARRPITLGLRTAQDVEVIGGLKGEELVVQAQAASLHEGQRVEVAQ